MRSVHLIRLELEVETSFGNSSIYRRSAGCMELNMVGRFVYAIATMDTKGSELDYVADCLRAAGVQVKTVDVGTEGLPKGVPDVTSDEVRGNIAKASYESRADAVTAMGESLKQYLLASADAGLVAGVIGIGGSGGTALITTAMRALDIGLPKLMVSTVASGNTAPYVDCSDVTMVYSVVDVAGLNLVSRKVLGNAAHAMAGMVQHHIESGAVAGALGMTMFGVTTPCVDAVRKQLEAAGNECLVFHATGTGGRAMEQLVESRLLKGVLDITTTEVADEVVGGIFPAGSERFNKLVESRVPLVLSLGALDMVNFGARETVPAHFSDRLLYAHNAQVTLMRTNAEENRLIAHWIASRIRNAISPIYVVIPELGLSALDAPGHPFHAPDINAILFRELEEQLQGCAACHVVRVKRHINEREFADSIVQYYNRLAKR